MFTSTCDNLDMTQLPEPPFDPCQQQPGYPESKSARLERIRRLIDSMVNLPDAVTAGPAACALMAAEFADAGISLAARNPRHGADSGFILADYPPGIGLGDTHNGETISASIDLGGTVAARSVIASIVAWRSRGDRLFTCEERELLAAIAPRFARLAAALIETTAGRRPYALDPETGFWPLPGFLSEVDRRFDRLDIEERVGAMFAIGWLRIGGQPGPEASSVIIRESAQVLREMLRPGDLFGRVGPTRLAAWCDGVDHLVAAERGDRIVERLDGMLGDSLRHAAIGIAARWPRSGDTPASALGKARAGLEQARLTASAQSRPAVRIWHDEAAPEL